MAERDVVIVGAGIAGLTAARDLARGGLTVTVLESTQAIGGKLRAHTVAGLQLDAGAESFASRQGTVKALVEELGLGDSLATPNPAGAWLQQANGRAHPLPRAGLLGIPTTPMAREVLDIVGFAGAFRAQLDSLMPGVIGAGESRLGPLVRKRMGRRVLDRLVAPVVSGVHSRHPDELDVDTVAPGLRDRLRTKDTLAQAVLALRAAAPAGSSVAGLSGGVHRLAAELARELSELGVELRLGCTARDVDATGVTTEAGERIPARAAVLTSATPATGTPITLATLVVDLESLDEPPRGTGVLVEAGTPGIRAKALTHATAKWPWLAQAAGEHHHVLRLSYGGRLDGGDLDEIARTDAGKLLQLNIPASSVLGFARVDWLSAAVDPPAAPRGVTAIGEAVSGTGLASVIGHARATATRILSQLAESVREQGDDGQYDNQPDGD